MWEPTITPVRGEPFTFMVSSRSSDIEHRVDLLGRRGFSECSCGESRTAVQAFIRAGGRWSHPKSSCAHVKAARNHLMFSILTDVAKSQPKNEGI